MRYELNESYFVEPFKEININDRYFSWFEDETVCEHNSHGVFPMTPQRTAEFYDRTSRRENLVWSVNHTSDGHIGNVSLQQIDLLNRNAEVAIIIGEKAHWGSGVGKLAVRAALGHGFRFLNLHKIYLGTAAGNIGMVSIAKSLGMRLEGRRVAHRLRDGEWYDIIEFALFSEDFDG